MTSELPPTAYGPEVSRDYDETRFRDPHGRLFSQLEMEQFSKLVDRLTGGESVLEVGCGTGRFMATALAAGATVCGLDASPYMLSIARKKMSQFNQSSYVLADGAAVCFPDNSFDYVYSIRTINQLPSRAHAFKTIEEMIRLCRPGGAILVEFINKWGLNRFGRSVRLSIRDIRILVDQHPSVGIANVSGILILSPRAMTMTPVRFLNLFGRIDRAVARCFPTLCARCYVLLEKN